MQIDAVSMHQYDLCMPIGAESSLASAAASPAAQPEAANAAEAAPLPVAGWLSSFNTPAGGHGKTLSTYPLNTYIPTCTAASPRKSA